jgi:hypothetical protein
MTKTQIGKRGINLVMQSMGLRLLDNKINRRKEK